MEPAVAESWEFSSDGRELTFRLRGGVHFSDDTPLTAEDVVFTFRALYDPGVASPLADLFRVDGEELVPEVVDPGTVKFRLPRRTAPILRAFDSMPILPKHRLEASLSDGSFASAYGVGARRAISLAWDLSSSNASYPASGSS